MKRVSTTSLMKGFSLVEVAIVLLVLSLALGGLLGAVGQSTENTRRLETRNKLREIEESLYAFAQVQGRLPCPADDDTSGFEDVSNTTSGVCGLTQGLLPNATLGLTGGVDENGFLTDPWGNPYRYSVAGQTVSGYRYTGTAGIQNIYDNAATNVVNNSNMLQVCDNSACSGSVMANVVPAIVLSMGNNGALIGSSSSAAEQANGYGAATTNSLYDVSNSVTFVVTDYSEDNFDDMLIWVSPHLLFGKLIQAGKLP